MGFIRNKRRQLLVHFDHAGESVLSGRAPTRRMPGAAGALLVVGALGASVGSGTHVRNSTETVSSRYGASARSTRARRSYDRIMDPIP